MTILLVEDDPIHSMLVTEILDLAGFKTIQVRSLADAQSKISDRISCVVTDYHIGNDRGCDVVHLARSLEIPAILITGSGDREAIARAVNFGARFVLVKPYSGDELVKKIRIAIDENSSRSHIQKFMRRFGRGDGQ